jgi:acyl-CoA reductase-like NAD-dependent aldehyde dehydrogenase
MTEQWQPVYDPAAPKELVGYAASATQEQARSAVDAANQAWHGWSRLAPEQRASMLSSALGALEEDFEKRVELLVRENGKVRAEAEIELGVFAWRSELAIELAGELRRVSQLDPLTVRPQPRLATEGDHATVHRRYVAPPFRSEVSRMSLGVVSIIVPYNWPIAILAASLPYALIAGNTAVVKPPPSAPLCLLHTMRLLASRLPPGVLNVISGTNEAMAPLIRNPLVRRVVFTGSTSAGIQIMKMAAENMTRVTLELGGNDPALVLEDADLGEEAIRRLVTGAFLTSGQVCMGIKRIYVHRSRYDELVGRMSELLKHYVVGHGLEPETTMGPLNNARQRDIVVGMCDEARSAGYEVVEFGELAEQDAGSGGYFLRPSLVLNPSPELRIVTEEQFGPALPICAFDDLDPVVDRVNDEWAGLCSSVWTTDGDRARDVAARLRTGTTWVNNANAVAQDDRAPFGGFRMSGMGRELGLEGLFDFTELHTVTYPS